MKTVGIMQPYFLPYIGYWQLVAAVDTFVVYDNIEYTKKGWFNRNRILVQGDEKLFTIPVKKDSDYLPVNQRYRADESDIEIARILRIIQLNYQKASQFAAVYPLIEECFLYPEKNLFAYIYNSIEKICSYLNIQTEFVVSSQVSIDPALKAEKKVLALCRALEAEVYINTIGGVELYNKQEFSNNGIDLKFIESKSIEYLQLGKSFVPWLSIIDVMMFNTVEEVQKMLNGYSLR